MSPDAAIFIGIQASGKSTFYVNHFADTHIRINLDMLRTRHREKLLISACVEARQSFVVDNTNPTREDRRRYFDFLQNSDFRVVGYYFNANLEKCLERNATRDDSRRIPEVGIRGALSRLELPRYDEGFDELHYVKPVGDGAFLVDTWQDEV